MRYKQDWDAARGRWEAYWRHQNRGLPLMCVIARRPEIEGGRAYGEIMCQGRYYDMPEALQWVDTDDQYCNAGRMVERYRFFCAQHEFLADSFPNLCIDFGPGSLAAYLGSPLRFAEETVWTEPCLEDLTQPIRFAEQDACFQRHLELARACRALVGDDFPVDMPDLMENLDALAALRGTQALLMDTILDPESVEQRLEELAGIYYEYYDRFYEIIRAEGGSAYTVFQIWGPGRTIKLQCDISAMLSPESFRHFAVPHLRRQARGADNVLYHLDGEDAIRHLDAVLEIDEIDVLQWTSGDNGPDGTFPQWDGIYEKALQAGKSIWVKVYTGSLDDWIRSTDRLVRKFGSRGLFLHYLEMSRREADALLDYARRHWSDVSGG